MGLFRRAPAAAPASPPPTSPTPPDPGPLGSPAWATLPPLATTTGAPEPTFKIGAAVKEDLVALDSPRLSHGMGHLVSGDGPPGVIDGLASLGVQRSADGAGALPAVEMPMAPLPEGHHADDGHDHSQPPETWVDPAPAFTAPVVAETWTAPASPTTAAAPDEPARPLPAAPGPVPMPVAAPVQRQADTAAPAPVPPAPASAP